MAASFSLKHMLLLCFVLLLTTFVTAEGLTTKRTEKSLPKLIDATVEDLAKGLEAGEFTSVDLVKAYIARINEVNDTLHMVTEINPDALALAEQMDDERSKGKPRSPLHGLPILIKNNIATKDKMSNTAGSFALYGATVPRDSGMAAKLRKAGAIILGKTNLSQWANFRSNNSTNGWSAYGDQTFAAYYPAQDPSGSSSGSGVASSIGLALAALGTETSGSILSPASVNNLVGIKPTVGLTSRALVVPISQRQDTVGPMTRTVKDAAYILQAIAGKDPNDNYTSAIPFHDDHLPDYVAACRTGSLRGKRIGIPRNVLTPTDGEEIVLAAFEKAIATIRSLGATIVDNTNITAYALDQYLNSNVSLIVLGADFVSDLPNSYLSKLTTNPNKVFSLQEVSDFTHRFPQEDYPDRDTAVFDLSLALGFNNTSPEFWPYYQNNLLVAGPEGILGALKNHTLDALILPTDYSPGLPALVGTPVVTVPMGFYPYDTPVQKNSRGLVEVAPNLPFGLSFLGPAWSEEKLISYAYAYEQKTQVRNKVQPYIVPNTELCNVKGEC